MPPTGRAKTVWATAQVSAPARWFSIESIFQNPASEPGPMTRVYDVNAKTIDGIEQPLTAYEGKTLLVVNVASKCGFTPQYAGLEAMYRKFKDKASSCSVFRAISSHTRSPATKKRSKASVP
jgi:hypothetical protein